jgi:predicted ATPase
MDFLKINQFKCFEDADIHLNQLTVMAGANGNGKSTTIQALLYLRRTIEHCGEWYDNRYHLNKTNSLNVSLNGAYCLALGNSTAVLNKNYSDNEILIGYHNETESLNVLYEADDRESRIWLTPKDVECSYSDVNPILKQQFYYLNAERIGPRVNQSIQFWDYPNAGWQGEYTAQLIGMESGFYKIDIKRKYKDTESLFLEDQVNYWLNFIMKGVKVKIESNYKTLTAQVLLENEYTLNEPTLATNLGFGISYILPIIATGLVAAEGSFLVVENPEAHLHPSAQSNIGRFLAVIAASGVKVIVETHSDHIINGIQIAVAEKILKNTKVTINFFGKAEGISQPEVLPISINVKGELSDWPKGFFDQTQIDYAYLFNLNKNE